MNRKRAATRIAIALIIANEIRGLLTVAAIAWGWFA